MEEIQKPHIEQEPVTRIRALRLGDVNWDLYGKQKDIDYVKKELGTEGFDKK